AFATWLHRLPHITTRRKPAVILGMDGRLGGDILMHTAAQALRAAGSDALIADNAMTPTIGFLVGHTAADAGIIITASHNPQEWNGLKLIVRANPDQKLRKGKIAASAPPAALAAEIIALYREGRIDWQPPENIGDDLF